MADEYGAVDSQQGSPAVFMIIDPLFELFHIRFNKKVGEFASPRAGKNIFQRFCEHLGHAFAYLQRYVSDETVADYYVGRSAVNLLGLQISYKIYRAFFEHGACRAGYFIPLPFFLAYVQKAGRRAGFIKNMGSVNRPHYSELEKNLRFAVNIGAGVQ